MRRREFLRAVGFTGLSVSLSLPGCIEIRGQPRTQAVLPPLADDRPDAVYHPTHSESMVFLGTETVGDYKLGLTYSFPERFWNVTGQRTSRVDPTVEDDIHLMATVWDAKTGVVLPVASGVDVEILRGDETVEERTLWPMLSQNMGFHYGDNLSLDGNGRYVVRVSVPGMEIERAGDFEGKFGDGGTVDFAFEYTRSSMKQIPYKKYPGKMGERDAIEPRELEVVPPLSTPSRSTNESRERSRNMVKDYAIPVSASPRVEDIPGDTLGTQSLGDTLLCPTLLGVETDSDEDDTDIPRHIAVSPRTAYNSFPLPMASLAARLVDSGETVFESYLEARIDPEIGYHYATSSPVDSETLDSAEILTVTVETPPQVARHEGYETAFMRTGDVSFEI